MPNTLGQSYLETSVWKPDLFKGKVAFITGGAVSTLFDFCRSIFSFLSQHGVYVMLTRCSLGYYLQSPS